MLREAAGFRRLFALGIRVADMRKTALPLLDIAGTLC